jgi:hypothetical protein
MLADPYNHPPPDVEERYQSACSTSSLKVEAEKGGSADVLIAAGWSDSRVGMALLRLHSEYDGAAKPKRMGEAAIRALAEANPDDRGKPRMTWARTESLMWHRRELRLLAQSLKSRASVLEQLTQWAAMKGIDPALVGPAVHHWLAPTCVVCDGHGRRKLPDAPALSGKPCHACNGSGHTPHPQGSARVLGHIDYVVQVARNSLKKRLRAG